MIAESQVRKFAVLWDLRTLAFPRLMREHYDGGIPNSTLTVDYVFRLLSCEILIRFLPGGVHLHPVHRSPVSSPKGDGGCKINVPP